MSSYLPEIEQAVVTTLKLFVIAMLVGTATGVLVGVGRSSAVKPIATIFLVYSWFWRALPLLFILYFGFYGLPLVGLSFSPFTTAAALLSLSSGAYIGEIVRGGIAAIPKAQWDAAGALGLSRIWTWRRIILPQVMAISIGPYISQSILVLKGTSLAGVVGVQEVTGTSYSLINQTYRVWNFLLLAAGIYLALSAVLALGQYLVERTWRSRFA